MRCPFVIAIDTREQAPFTFDRLRADVREGGAALNVQTERRSFLSGDYSIKDHENEIAIERKSLSDLFGSIGKEHKRFKREIIRLSAMRYAAVVAEADWAEILAAPPKFTQLPPKIVYRTILAWQLEFPSVHWWLCPGRNFAEITTFRLLERFWKRKAKKQSSDNKGQ